MGSESGLLPQEDAAGEGTGLRAVASALGGHAAQRPGQESPECGQSADPERGKAGVREHVGGWGVGSGTVPGGWGPRQGSSLSSAFTCCVSWGESPCPCERTSDHSYAHGASFTGDFQDSEILFGKIHIKKK